MSSRDLNSIAKIIEIESGGGLINPPSGFSYGVPVVMSKIYLQGHVTKFSELGIGTASTKKPAKIEINIYLDFLRIPEEDIVEIEEESDVNDDEYIGDFYIGRITVGDNEHYDINIFASLPQSFFTFLISMKDYWFRIETIYDMLDEPDEPIVANVKRIYFSSWLEHDRIDK